MPKKSIHLVTAHILNCLTEISSDEQFEEVEAIVEEGTELHLHVAVLVYSIPDHFDQWPFKYCDVWVH